MANASLADGLVTPITPWSSRTDLGRPGLKSRAKFSIRIVDDVFSTGSAKHPPLDPAIELLENLP